jgi:hypothetical protein
MGGLKLMSEVKPKLTENRDLLKHFNSEIEVITEGVVESYEKCRLDHDQDRSFSLKTAIACHDEVRRLVRQKVLEELEEAYGIGSKDAVSADHKAEVLVRSVILVMVVAVVAAMSIIALVLQLDPHVFTTYLAPIVGIAGTVIGYWFGSAGRARECKPRR